MRRAAAVALAALSAGCTMVSPGPEPTAPPVRPAEPREARPRVEPRADPLPVRADVEEVRALWVVRFTMTSEESVRAMVEQAAAAGFNTLVVQVRGRADAYYRSDLEPRAEGMSGPESFDPLQVTIEEARRRGMAVHAWLNTHLVWGPTGPPQSPDHLVNAHPDWLAVPRALAHELATVDPTSPAYFAALSRYAAERPATVEGVYTSPSHPEVQDRVHAVWMDLARRYDLDGLHYDYIRFPSEDYDYSVGALERFRTWLLPRLDERRFAQLDERSGTDPLAFVDGEPGLWDTFRREQITALVDRIYRSVKALRPEMTVSAAVVADLDVAHRRRFQEWDRWLRDGIVDVVAPMAYTAERDQFTRLVERARRAAGERERVWAGVGAYMNTPEGTFGMIEAARRADAGGVIVFSYDWVVGEGRGDAPEPLLERIGRVLEGR